MTGTINNNVITVRQGDSFALNLQISDKNGPADLTSAELTMQVRDSGNALMFEVIGERVDAEQGKMVLLITPANTNIAVGEYKCDIQLVGADGSVNTIFPANINQVGTFVITEQVTR